MRDYSVCGFLEGNQDWKILRVNKQLKLFSLLDTALGWSSLASCIIVTGGFAMLAE
jgi:hypothetical protein